MTQIRIHIPSPPQSELQKMSSVSLFITRHPLITLISLCVLYQLLPDAVEDDDDILRVVLSALLLKSDDPHQKPQHFPELPEPPPPRVGGKQTRVILLAYARSFFSFFSHFSHFPISDLVRLMLENCLQLPQNPSTFMNLCMPSDQSMEFKYFMTNL